MASAGYPDPLRSPVGKTAYGVTEAARLLHVAPRTIHSRVREGVLTAHREGRLLQIDADSLHPQRVPLADPADGHPFARLTVTLGALSDLLASIDVRHTGTPGPSLDQPAAATVAAHVLSVASVAARHALQYGPIADGMRPLLIAQYADRRYDALSHYGAGASLPMVAVTMPAIPPTTWTERLEAAANAWAGAARTDLSLTVPSLEVIRNVTNQAAHAHAATATILAAVAPALGSVDEANGGSGREGTERAMSILGDGIRALREADLALANRTTARRPSHAYASAARDLFAALSETRRAVATSVADPGAVLSLRTEPALRTLAAVNDQAQAMLRDSRQLPNVLIRAQLLFAPARTLRASTERLTARNTGRLAPVDFGDPPDLTAALTRAEEAVARSQREVFHLLVREPVSQAWTPSPS
jgi:hypothetical protein